MSGQRTDIIVREKIKGMVSERIPEEVWEEALEYSLKDIYAHFLALGKDVPYEYFVTILPIALKVAKRGNGKEGI